MQINLINLARDVDRLSLFHQRNSRLSDVIRGPAFEGTLLYRAKLVADGVIAADLDYRLGAIGNAASHIENWRKAAEQNQYTTVAEDDAIFSYAFEIEAEKVLKLLPRDWDIILWGWNFDAFLFVNLLPGVSGAKVECNQHQMRQSIEQFQKLKASPVPMKLLHCFGLMCYSVSPKGARALLNLCLPLRPALVDFPGFGISISNDTIDAAMNATYPLLKAFVCLPPLVISENRHEISTVLR